MKAQHQFQKSQIEAATRLRSKFHSQSAVKHNTTSITQIRSGNYKTMSSLLKQLHSLQQDYSTSRSEGSRKAGSKLLEKVPAYNLDDDPRLAISTSLLRSASMMKLSAQAQGVQYATDMVIRHTYLLTNSSASNFVSAVFNLQPEKAKDLLTTLSPRLIELSEDFTVGECTTILQAVYQFGLHENERLVRAIMKTMRLYLAAAEPHDVCKAALAVSLVNPSSSISKAFFTEVFSALEDEISRLDAGSLITLCRSIRSATSRKTMNAIARRALSIGSSLSVHDASEVLHTYHVIGYRHTVLIRRLAMRQATRASEHSATSIALTLSTLSHFRMTDCEEIFAALSPRIVELAPRMSPFHCSALLHSFAKSGITEEQVITVLLESYVTAVTGGSGHTPSFSSACNFIWAVQQLELFTKAKLEKVLTKVFHHHHATLFKKGIRDSLLKEMVDGALVAMATHSSCPSGLKECAAKIREVI